MSFILHIPLYIVRTWNRNELSHEDWNKGISGSDLQKYSSQEKIKTGSFCMRIIYKELKDRKWRKWPKNIQNGRNKETTFLVTTQIF